MVLSGIGMQCIEIVIVIFSVWKNLVVYENKNRQKYLLDRKFFEIFRNEKNCNCFDLHVELIIYRYKKNSQIYILQFYIFKSNINASLLSPVPCFRRSIHLALSLVTDRGAEWFCWSAVGLQTLVSETSQ